MRESLWRARGGMLREVYHGEGAISFMVPLGLGRQVLVRKYTLLYKHTPNPGNGL